jgi:hypothetical protein
VQGLLDTIDELNSKVADELQLSADELAIVQSIASGPGTVGASSPAASGGGGGGGGDDDGLEPPLLVVANGARSAEAASVVRKLLAWPHEFSFPAHVSLFYPSSSHDTFSVNIPVAPLPRNQTCNQTDMQPDMQPDMQLDM